MVDGGSVAVPRVEGAVVVVEAGGLALQLGGYSRLVVHQVVLHDHAAVLAAAPRTGRRSTHAAVLASHGGVDLAEYHAEVGQDAGGVPGEVGGLGHVGGQVLALVRVGHVGEAF